MAHKILHKQGELDPELWFDRITGDRITRANSDPLNVKSRGGRLEIRKNFFSNRVASHWNAVPADIKMLPDTKKFKTAFNRWSQTNSPRQQQARD
jgi:hypothetical protein